MEQLHTLAQLRARCTDPLVLWAAQDMRSNVQVWTHRAAVAAAVTGLARRDRVAVTGPVTDIAVIVRALLEAPGPRYRPLGDDDTISELCHLRPGLVPYPPFGLMTTTRAPAPGTAQQAGDGEWPAIGRILDDALPDSLARPGQPEVRRWWVEADACGVAACAADAWSAPSVGLLAGVATATRARGRGLGKSVTATALSALIHDYGTAVLMVEASNTAARSLYRSFGMSYRSVRGAAPPAAASNGRG